jgi:hypothetical protein
MRNNQGKVPVVYPENVEPLMDIPSGEMDTQAGIVHDIAHHVVDVERGIKFIDGIRSHLHPENIESDAVMSAPIDWTPFVDENGNIDPVKLRPKIADIAATFVAGGVANDLYHDIPLDENGHIHADIRILRKYLREVGFFGSESKKMIAQAVDDATKILLQPGVKDVIEQHASVREAGLDKEHHISQQRMEQILRDVKAARDSGTPVLAD